MKFAIYDYNKLLNTSNRIFEKTSYAIGENLNSPAEELRNSFQVHGHELNTIDMCPIDEISGIIFFDMPPDELDLESFSKYGVDLFLVMIESNIIKPDNNNLEKHRLFKYIFTWNDAFIDNVKYFKIMISHRLPDSPEIANVDRTRFSTMIAGNKKSKLKNELYTERLRAIRWFERRHPDLFDLYGFGWDSFDFPPLVGIRSLNRFKFLRRLFGPRLKNYRGKIDSKSDVLKRYRFSFAYENVYGDKGYITEKIFDSLFSFSVPVYLGAPDISRYVPAKCFIDKREFATYESLFKYLQAMTDEEYKERQDAIKEFLQSREIEIFDSRYFGRTIATTILRLT